MSLEWCQTKKAELTPSLGRRPPSVTFDGRTRSTVAAAPVSLPVPRPFDGRPVFQSGFTAATLFPYGLPCRAIKKRSPLPRPKATEGGRTPRRWRDCQMYRTARSVLDSTNSRKTEMFPTFLVSQIKNHLPLFF